MKKTILLLFIIPFFNYGQSNQILDFKSGYSSETIYNQTTFTSSDYVITYTASEEMLERLKQNGMSNPTTIKKAYTVETATKTGKIGKDGNFPLTIEYLKSSDEEGKSIIPSGTMLYGSASAVTMPQMDSIVANDSDESFKKMIFETVKNTFSQVVMPQKKLKIGESFTQENPLNIPMAGINIEMVVLTTYTLKSMNPKNAFFDIMQTYTIKMSNNKFETSGTGNGSGKLVYDIPNHFINQNDLKMEFSLNLKQNNFGVELKSKSDFKQTAIISKNK